MSTILRRFSAGIVQLPKGDHRKRKTAQQSLTEVPITHIPRESTR